MGELLGRVLPLALGAAISPVVVTVVVLVLSSPRRPVARGVAFTLGVLTMIAVLSIVGLAVLGEIGDRGRGAHRGAVADTVDVVLGLVLLALAARSLLRHAASDDETSASPAHEASGGLGRSYVLGVAMMLTNFSTVVLYLPAMKEIDRAAVSDGDKAVVLAVAALITALPALVPLALRVAVPGPSQRLLRAVGDGVTRHRRAITIVVEIAFGAYLLAKGL